MKTSAFILTGIGLLAMLAACRQPEADTVESKVSPGHGVEMPRPGHLRGTLVMGKDGFGLTDCENRQQKIVTLAPEAQLFVDAWLQQGGSQEFFVDGRGLASAGALEIRSIERAGGEVSFCLDASFEAADFIVHGTEPFWSLTVTGRRLAFQQPDAAAQEFASADIAVGTQTAGENVRIRAQGSSGKLELGLERRPCGDGMSDAMFAWSATLELAGKSWQGCAYSGRP